MRGEDRSDPLLALAVATSVEKCVVCGDPSAAVGVLIEGEKTKLYGLCGICAFLMRGAKPPFFLVGS